MSSPAPLPSAPAQANRRSALREDLETSILHAAEAAFATHGFEGTSIASIAQAAGISKQNLMYYFPNKLLLYRRVLDDVLTEWLDSMRELARSDAEPAAAMEAYIRAKLELSRTRPAGSRVFALEVISGANIYGPDLRKKVIPPLREDIAMLERWIAQKQALPISAEHLFFVIWAATQAYADWAPQMLLLLGRKTLTPQDFDTAHRTICDMVLRALGINPAAPTDPILSATTPAA